MDTVTLDRWVAELMDCNPLTEAEVESLCDKVARRRRSGRLSARDAALPEGPARGALTCAR